MFELSVSYISIKINEFFKIDCLSVDECIDMYLRLLKLTSPSQYDYYDKFLSNLDDYERIVFIQSIMDEDSIYFVIEPMSENMNLERLQALYDEFPWITMENILMPIIDSVGEVRYVNSRRPVVYGYLYYYRLKQYAEEKFSVTSLSSTNVKNENTKNKASNNFKALFPRTPIRFGEMELGNMCHLGADLMVMMLMLYSSSPLARELCSQIQTGDPFNIDVKLDMDSKNRNAEILNVFLKVKGLRIAFKKYIKEHKNAISISPITFVQRPEEELLDPIIIYGKDEKFSLEKAIEELKASRDKGKSPVIFYPIEFRD